MRMRKKKNLTARMEACSRYGISDPASLRGSWRSLCPQAREVHVEVGCGKGRFTAGTAQAHPDVLLIAIEKVPDAMVVAMERCRDAGLTNVFFVDGDAAALPDYFAPGEVDRLYINFCDPWPKSNQARRRLTHGNFLQLYRRILKSGGEIHFKTDNDKLFAWSLEEIPQFGFALSEVTTDLHAQGPVGVMTDYEAKFYQDGKNINRCVAALTEAVLPFPTDLHRVKSRWMDAFALSISPEELGRQVFAAGGHLWNVFQLRPCLAGEDARQALAQLDISDAFVFWEDGPVQPLGDTPVPDLAEGFYLVDRDFSWTYAQTDSRHAFFCRRG